MPALCVEVGLHEPVSVSCVAAVPILKKMKVLKKFRRRIGFGMCAVFFFLLDCLTTKIVAKDYSMQCMVKLMGF